MIQALASDRADEALREGVLPRALGRRQDFIDPYALHALPEHVTVDRVAIAEEIGGRGVLRLGPLRSRTRDNPRPWPPAGCRPAPRAASGSERQYTRPRRPVRRSCRPDRSQREPRTATSPAPSRRGAPRTRSGAPVLPENSSAAIVLRFAGLIRYWPVMVRWFGILLGTLRSAVLTHRELALENLAVLSRKSSVAILLPFSD